MPVQFTYPGVYVQELPSGTHTVTGAATSIAAFVGYLRRGPMNSPVQCTSFGDFQRVFGGLDAESVTSFQVSQFFLNGGTEAWVSRVCADDSPPVWPETRLYDLPPANAESGTAGRLMPSGRAQLAVLRAQNPGSWGENIFVTIDPTTGEPDTFNLTATLYDTGNGGFHVVQTQNLNGVSPDANRANSIAAAIQANDQNDNLLAVPDFTAAPPPTAPAASGTILAFTPQEEPIAASLTLIVQPPQLAPGDSPAELRSTFQTPFTISTTADLLEALERLLTNAAPALGVPGLADAKVRRCSPQGGGEAECVQFRLPDPTLADYLVSVTSEPAIFTVRSINYQAHRLVSPLPASTHPDGLPPTGFDVAGNAVARTGIHSLDAAPAVNLIAVPDMAAMGTSDYLAAATATVDYAVQRRAFAILDMPSDLATVADAEAWAQAVPASLGSGIVNAASYWPQIEIPTPLSAGPLSLGASGTLAGIYALTDATRGVWKAPAGIGAALAGVQQLAYVMNDADNDRLNALGINALRAFPIYGNIAWGARTLGSGNAAYNDWRYISVRRLALYIEQSLMQGLQWVVFEPNGPSLWAQIRLSAGAFLGQLYAQGAFIGSKPEQAYQVVCDASTTTPEDIDNGIVNILILFAPVLPGEFIILRLQLMAGQAG